MAYEKQTWTDNESPLNAERMNHIEDGVSALSEEMAGLTATRKVACEDWVMDGYFYNTSGDTVDLNGDTSKVNNSEFYFQKVAYKKGETYYITGKGGQSCRLWNFVSDDGTILSKALKDATVTDYVLTYDEDCTLLLQVNKSFNYSLYKDVTANVAEMYDVLNEKVEKLEGDKGTAYVFGTGIDCDYTTPAIPEFVDQGYGKRLAYFYGLYDALVAAYPDYVTKVDCDADMAAAGIAKPENLSAYPMYMYKFSPAFTPGSAALGAPTISNPIKLFVTTGTHGEFMAIWDMYQTMRLVCEEWQSDTNLEALRWECEIYVLPCSGLVTVDNGWRVNVNKVDLNRNCPTKGWAVKGEAGVDNTYTGTEAGSEYETKVFMHYLAAINPHVYVDHHNSSHQEYCSFYAEAKEQSLINIAAATISSRSRKLRMNLEGVYPENDWKINGFVQTPKDKGSRCLYAYEQGYHSITFETYPKAYYENGEAVPEGTDAYTETACTIAVDGFLNFTLLALKELAKQPYVPAK